MKINLKKIILGSLILVLSLNILSLDFSLAQNTGPSDAAIQSIGTLNPNGNGIIDCDTSSNPRPCNPSDFFKMLSKLSKLFLYILIICIGLGGIIIGAMYPFYGDNPAMLGKMKSALWKFVTALIGIVLATTLVFALMSQLGANSSLLDIIKKLVSSNTLIETSYAQGIGSTQNSNCIAPLVFDPQTRSCVSATGADSGVVNPIVVDIKTASDATMNDRHYTNFFGTADPIVLIHNLISFLVVYIAIPMLTLAVIWTGFLFIKAQGNSTEIDKAKKWALRSVLGIIIAASATFLSDLFFNSLSFILNK